MLTSSITELHLSSLQLALDLGVGIAIAIIAWIAYSTALQQVGQEDSWPKKPSFRLLEVLGSGLLIGSVIVLLQLLTLRSFPILLLGLISTLLLALLSVVIPKKKSVVGNESIHQALSDTEAPYCLLIQHSTNLSRHTLERNYLYASPTCQTLLEYDAEELVGHSTAALVHPQNGIPTTQSHATSLNPACKDTVSDQIYPKDREYIWVETTCGRFCNSHTGVIEEMLTISRDITQPKPVEEALPEQECQFQMLTANVPGMIYQFLRRTDGSVYFPFVSNGAREIYELEPSHIQQNPGLILDMIHPEDRLNFEKSVELSATTLQPWQWQGRVVLASGCLKWIKAASRPELQANGDILWDGMLIDITERKQAEIALHESEQQFRTIFEQVGVAIAQVGVNGKFLQVNPKLSEITGYSREELLQKTVVDITHPEDQATTELHLDQFFAGQRQTLNLEKRYIHKMGAIVWANVTVSSIWDAHGTPKYFISVIEDITQRKHIQAEFEKANRERINIFESITDAFFAVNHTWQFTYINSKAEQVLGCLANQMLGKNLWEEFPEMVGSAFEQQYRRAVSEQVSVKFEEFYSPLQLWLVVRAYPYEGGLSVYLSNITERKQAEAALLEQSRLSTLVAKVGVTLAEGGALSVILQRCTEAMVQQIDTISAAIWTVDSTSQQLEQQAFMGTSLCPTPEHLYHVAQTHCPYLIVDDDGSEGIYPLVVEERFIGIIAVAGNQPLSQDAHRTLSWVANAIAVAVDRYWARCELLTRRESLLFELANHIRNSLEFDTILETAVASIRSLLQIDRCLFLWYRPNASQPYWEVVKEAKTPQLPSYLGQYTPEQVQPLTQRLLQQPITQVDRIELCDDPALQQLLLDLGYTSLLCLPVETHTGEIGAICCGHCTASRPWEVHEVELLQAVVAQLAIALDQAELYAQARETARIAQAQTQQLERTLNQLQMTQAHLIQSAKMSSLGQLVAGMAHEINNPINFIHNNLTYASAYFYDLLNLLRLYQEHFPDPGEIIVEQAELINIDFIATDLPKLLTSMQRGTDRIRSIVLGLRNFSRLDEAQMKKVDVHEGINSTLLILQHRLKPNGKKPEIQVFQEYGQLPLIECYPGELNQVFMNILSNAIEAFDQPDHVIQEQPLPSITIRTHLAQRSDSPDLATTQNHPDSNPSPTAQSVVIQIIDNGPGMSEEVKARLFDPFFTTKIVGQGMGLGLTISYQIVVEHHHGVLMCTSALGEGTEFWIEIPLQQTY